ncbi:MAG: glycosyltransferase [Candidatus Melainabacteria bacterium]|jgi:glycosyltransferase involved in cell wall biosynthesis|nr:glycosyltransferase [Candidatus Melainabacteria bacterium]
MAFLKHYPLVTIVTPAYRQGRFVATLCESLLAQTYSNIQYIFLDDCSDDDTFAIARSYEDRLREKFASVRIERNERNLGMLPNLAKAFAQTDGEFLTFLEADDYYLPRKIERNIEFFELNPDFAMVYSDSGRLRQDFTYQAKFNANTFSDRVTMPHGWIFEDLLQCNYINTPTTLVRREAFLRSYQFDLFAQRNYMMADYPGILNVARIGQIGYIAESLAVYRQLDESASHSKNPDRLRMFADAIARVRIDAMKSILRPFPQGDPGSREHLLPAI